MPLKKAVGKGKSAFQKAVSENMHELKHFSTKKRSHKQQVAIALESARGKKKK